MTNEHVFEDASAVRESIAQFRYERDVHGLDVASVDFGFRLAPAPIISRSSTSPSSSSSRGRCAAKALEPFAWLRLDPTPGKAFVGEYLTIIQHPKGERKQICVRENKLLKYADRNPYVWYETDTGVGLVRLAGVQQLVGRGGAAPQLGAGNQAREGEGRLADARRQGLDRRHGRGRDRVEGERGHPREPHRRASLVEARDASARARRIDRQGSRASHTFSEKESTVDLGAIQVRRTGALSIFIPAAVPAVAEPEETEEPAAPLVAPQGLPVLEKVVVNQTNYAKRNGYSSRFLGAGATVPLPKVAAETFGKLFLLPGKKAELKYWNYSVLLNQTRALAYFSAANVDAAKFRGKPRRGRRHLVSRHAGRRRRQGGADGQRVLQEAEHVRGRPRAQPLRPGSPHPPQRPAVGVRATRPRSETATIRTTSPTARRSTGSSTRTTARRRRPASGSGWRTPRSRRSPTARRGSASSTGRCSTRRSARPEPTGGCA
jgi:endonuclease G